MRLINSAVDINADILREAVGSQGTVSARLAQILEDDGSLKVTAVDGILHNIGAHTDGEYESVEYVRMKLEERQKLELIADSATNMVLEFNTPSNIATFDTGPVEFIASSGVTWSAVSPNKVQANLTFPVSSAHKHYYRIIPQYDGPPDFQHYKTGYPNYIEGSLRVTINGVRIFEDGDVYVPGSTVSEAWTLQNFSGDETTGQFVLMTPLTLDDVIRVDFDVALT